MSEANAIEAYWSRAGIGQAILDALSALGKDGKALTVDDLAPLDQFHGGGKPATARLAGSPRCGPTHACSTWAAASAARRGHWPPSSDVG